MAAIARVFSLLVCIVRGVYNLLRPGIVMMTGRARGSGDPVTICYVGQMRRGYRLGFPSQVLASLDEEKDLGRRWVWQLRAVVASNSCAFALVESSDYLRRFFQLLPILPSVTLFLPFFVHATIRSADIPNLLRGKANNLKSDLRITRKMSYTPIVTTDTSDYKIFLESYYKPHLLITYGSLASLFDYSFMCQENFVDSKNWELLKVMQGDDWVAGLLVKKVGETAYCMEIGMRDGKSNSNTKGARAAAYWFFVERMAALGYPELSFMWSPPFLENGVLRFKRKYRPKLTAAPSADKGLLLFDIGRNSITHNVLRKLSVIHLENSRLKVRAFVTDPAEISAERDRLATECRGFSGIGTQDVIILG